MPRPALAGVDFGQGLARYPRPRWLEAAERDARGKTLLSQRERPSRSVVGMDRKIKMP